MVVIFILITIISIGVIAYRSKEELQDDNKAFSTGCIKKKEEKKLAVPEYYMNEMRKNSRDQYASVPIYGTEITTTSNSKEDIWDLYEDWIKESFVEKSWFSVELEENIHNGIKTEKIKISVIGNRWKIFSNPFFTDKEGDETSSDFSKLERKDLFKLIDERGIVSHNEYAFISIVDDIVSCNAVKSNGIDTVFCKINIDGKRCVKTGTCELNLKTE